jgi:hypothetical protein
MADATLHCNPMYRGINDRNVAVAPDIEISMLSHYRCAKTLKWGLSVVRLFRVRNERFFCVKPKHGWTSAVDGSYLCNTSFSSVFHIRARADRQSLDVGSEMLRAFCERITLVFLRGNAVEALAVQTWN